LHRTLAGLAAGALVALALERLGTPPSVDPLAAAGAAAAAVGVLPRLGWLASAAAVAGWFFLVQPGAALVVLSAIAVAPLTLPRAGTLWSLPALAPGLGAAGVPTLFLAAAGRAASGWRRAALGAAGAVWLLAAGMLSGRGPLAGGTPPPQAWEVSLGAAVDAILPVAAARGAPLAAAWALLAWSLPLLVRGGSRARLTGAIVWAVAAAAAHFALARIGGLEPSAAEAAGVLGGIVLASAVAMPAASRRRPGRGGRALERL
jgi:hypothetical protein